MLKYIFGNQDFDIDFNVAHQSGRTPLHIACYNGQFEVVKFLLENSKEKGIDIYKKANDQKTAQDLAKEKGHNNILEILEAWTLQEIIEDVNFVLLRLPVFSQLFRLYRRFVK